MDSSSNDDEPHIEHEIKFARKKSGVKRSTVRTIKLCPGASLDRLTTNQSSINTKTKVEEAARLHFSKLSKSSEKVSEFKLVDDMKRVAKLVYVKNDKKNQRPEPSVRKAEKPSTMVRPVEKMDDPSVSERKITWRGSSTKTELDEYFKTNSNINIRKVNATPTPSNIYKQKFGDDYTNEYLKNMGVHSLKKPIPPKLKPPVKSGTVYRERIPPLKPYEDIESQITKNYITKGNANSTKVPTNTTPKIVKLTPQPVNKTRLIKIDKSKLIPISSIEAIHEKPKPKPKHKVKILEDIMIFKPPVKKPVLPKNTHNAAVAAFFPKKFTLENIPKKPHQKVIVEKIAPPELNEFNSMKTKKVTTPRMGINFENMDLEIALENDIIFNDANEASSIENKNILIFPDDNVDDSLELGLDHLVLNTQTGNSNSFVDNIINQEDGLIFDKQEDIEILENQVDIQSENEESNEIFENEVDIQLDNQENNEILENQEGSEDLDNQVSNFIDGSLLQEGITENNLIININNDGEPTIKEDNIDSENNYVLGINENQIVIHQDEAGNEIFILMNNEDDVVVLNKDVNVQNQENAQNEYKVEAEHNEGVEVENANSVDEILTDNEIILETFDPILSTNEVILISDDAVVSVDEQEIREEKPIDDVSMSGLKLEPHAEFQTEPVKRLELSPQELEKLMKLKVVSHGNLKLKPNKELKLELHEECSKKELRVPHIFSKEEIEDSSIEYCFLDDSQTTIDSEEIPNVPSVDAFSTASSQSFYSEDETENASIKDEEMNDDSIDERSIKSNDTEYLDNSVNPDAIIEGEDETSEINESFETVGENMSSSEEEDEVFEKKIPNLDNVSLPNLKAACSIPLFEDTSMEEEEDEIPSPVYEEITKNDLESLATKNGFPGFATENIEMQKQYQISNINKISEDIKNVNKHTSWIKSENSSLSSTHNTSSENFNIITDPEEISPIKLASQQDATNSSENFNIPSDSEEISPTKVASKQDAINNSDSYRSIDNTIENDSMDTKTSVSDVLLNTNYFTMQVDDLMDAPTTVVNDVANNSNTSLVSNEKLTMICDDIKSTSTNDELELETSTTNDLLNTQTPTVLEFKTGFDYMKCSTPKKSNDRCTTEDTDEADKIEDIKSSIPDETNELNKVDIKFDDETEKLLGNSSKKLSKYDLKPASLNIRRSLRFNKEGTNHDEIQKAKVDITTPAKDSSSQETKEDFENGVLTSVSSKPRQSLRQAKQIPEICSSSTIASSESSTGSIRTRGRSKMALSILSSENDIEKPSFESSAVQNVIDIQKVLNSNKKIQIEQPKDVNDENLIDDNKLPDEEVTGAESINEEQDEIRTSNLHITEVKENELLDKRNTLVKENTKLDENKKLITSARRTRSSIKEDNEDQIKVSLEDSDKTLSEVKTYGKRGRKRNTSPKQSQSQTNVEETSILNNDNISNLPTPIDKIQTMGRRSTRSKKESNENTKLPEDVNNFVINVQKFDEALPNKRRNSTRSSKHEICTTPDLKENKQQEVTEHKMLLSSTEIDNVNEPITKDKQEELNEVETIKGKKRSISSKQILENEDETEVNKNLVKERRGRKKSVSKQFLQEEQLKDEKATNEKKELHILEVATNDKKNLRSKKEDDQAKIDTENKSELEVNKGRKSLRSTKQLEDYEEVKLGNEKVANEKKQIHDLEVINNDKKNLRSKKEDDLAEIETQNKSELKVNETQFKSRKNLRSSKPSEDHEEDKLRGLKVANEKIEIHDLEVINSDKKNLRSKKEDDQVEIDTRNKSELEVNETQNKSRKSLRSTKQSEDYEEVKLGNEKVATEKKQIHDLEVINNDKKNLRSKKEDDLAEIETQNKSELKVNETQFKSRKNLRSSKPSEDHEEDKLRGLKVANEKIEIHDLEIINNNKKHLRSKKEDDQAEIETELKDNETQIKSRKSLRSTKPSEDHEEDKLRGLKVANAKKEIHDLEVINTDKKNLNSKKEEDHVGIETEKKSLSEVKANETQIKSRKSLRSLKPSEDHEEDKLKTNCSTDKNQMVLKSHKNKIEEITYTQDASTVNDETVLNNKKIPSKRRSLRSYKEPLDEKMNSAGGVEINKADQGTETNKLETLKSLTVGASESVTDNSKIESTTIKPKKSLRSSKITKDDEIPSKSLNQTLPSLQNETKRSPSTSSERRSLRSQINLQKSTEEIEVVKTEPVEKRGRKLSKSNNNVENIEHQITEVVVKIPLPLIDNSTKINKSLRPEKDHAENNINISFVDNVENNLETKIHGNEPIDADVIVQDSIISSAYPRVKDNETKGYIINISEPTKVNNKFEKRKSLRSLKNNPEIDSGNVSKSSNEAESTVLENENNQVDEPVLETKLNKALKQKRKSPRSLTEIEPTIKRSKDNEENSDSSDNIVLSDYKSKKNVVKKSNPRKSRLVKEIESLYPSYEVPNATAALSSRKSKIVKVDNTKPDPKRRSRRIAVEVKTPVVEEKSTIVKVPNANDKLGDIMNDVELIRLRCLESNLKETQQNSEDASLNKKSSKNLKLPATQIFEEIDAGSESGSSPRISLQQSPKKNLDEYIPLSRKNPPLKTYERRKRDTVKIKTEPINEEMIDVNNIKKEKVDVVGSIKNENGKEIRKKPLDKTIPKHSTCVPFIDPEPMVSVKKESSPSPTPECLVMDPAIIVKTEKDDKSDKYKEGDLVHAQLSSFPYWPSMISKSPETQNIIKFYKHSIAYHVRFFGDKNERAWIQENRIMHLKDINDLDSLYQKFKEKDPSAAKAFTVPKTWKKKWNLAVVEALSVKNKSIEEKNDFFFNKFASKREKIERAKLEEKEESFVNKSVSKKGKTKRPKLEEKEESVHYSELEAIEKSVQVSKMKIPKEKIKVNPLNRKNLEELNIKNLQEEKVTSSESGTSSPVIPPLKTPKRGLFKKNAASSSNSKTPMKLFKTKAEVKHYVKDKNVLPEINQKEEFKDVSKSCKSISEPSTSDTELSSKCSSASPSKLTTEMQKDLYKRNHALFNKSLNVNRVCQICLKPGDTFKCKGKCFGYFHYSCIGKENPEEHVNIETEDNNRVEIIDITDDYDPPPIVMRTDNVFQKLPLGDRIDETLQKLMNPMLNTTLYDYESSSTMKDVIVKTEPDELIQHVTGDDVIFIKKEFKCQKCSQEIKPPCFICGLDVSPKKTLVRSRCNVSGCGKFYHLDCLKVWPQTQYHLGEMKQDDYDSSAFTCPLHVCHTCVSDSPRQSYPLLPSNKIFRCVKCPASYHNSINCIPAGTDVLSATQIVCPRHIPYKKKRGKIKKAVMNTPWCFICAEGGKLVCCDSCPTSVHAECSQDVINPDLSYICEECQSGRLPLYDEIVWVKIGNSRWWPGLILLPHEIPTSILNLPHVQGEFVVEYYGSHEHVWVGSGRVFTFHDGDKEDAKTPKSKSRVDILYNTAVNEAVAAHAIKTQFKTKLKESTKSDTKPPPYKKIKANRPVGNVKHFDGNISLTNPCSCKEDNPCRDDHTCLNRMMMIECDPKTCPLGENCQNQRFEKREYPSMEPYKTNGRGWGLRALEFIKKGTFLIEYVGEVIDDEEYKRRSEKMHEQKVDNYYFLTIDQSRMIDAGPKGNISRFMNHCCQPNCVTQKWTVKGDTRVGLFAIEDIQKNTELTFNYNLESIGEDKKTCHCGAETCSGLIGAKPLDEKKVKKQSDKSTKAKKKSVTPPPVIEPCFICGKCDTPTYECSKQMCGKFYHMSCIQLSCKPESKWSCPWHTCSISNCDLRTIRCCTKCLNSYCPGHSDKNIRHDNLLGYVCYEHDPTKESQSLSTSIRSSSSEVNISTEEGDITSTTVDDQIKNFPFPKPGKVETSKKRKRTSYPMERPAKIFKSSVHSKKKDN